MIAAFLVVLAACTAASNERCAYEVASWEAPTAEELADCADRAEKLRAHDETAICELVPMADQPNAKRVSFHL